MSSSDKVLVARLPCVCAFRACTKLDKRSVAIYSERDKVQMYR